MKIVSYLTVAVVVALLVATPLVRKLSSLSDRLAQIECEHMRQTVEKQIDEMSQDLVSRIEAFGAAVSQEREFSMKLLVEHDPLAPEVTEIASRYMAPMGLGVLEVTDSAMTVVSSGHFPAKVGASEAGKAESVSAEPIFINENINGEQALTLQARVGFTCVDIPFFCFGGIVFDKAMLARLSPRQDVQVLLKQGERVSGMEGIVTMSSVANNRIIINDAQYLVSSFSLPTADSDLQGAEILVVMNTPAKKKLMELLK